MKKIYIPTTEELHNLQSLGANVYDYMLVKVIEALVMEDVVYKKQDMFEVAYEHLSEFSEIVYAIAKMYPERITSSTRASKDIELHRRMFERLPSQDKSIYYLDNLTYLGQDSELIDPILTQNTSKILSEKLILCPRYRFDYKEPNILLDRIFSCELPTDFITSETKDLFATIEPAYAVKFGEIEIDKKGRVKREFLSSIKRSMVRYITRYGLDFSKNICQGMDIISKPTVKTRKLIRCLEQHQQNYY